MTKPPQPRRPSRTLPRLWTLRTETSSRGDSREALSGIYSLTWTADGVLVADLYLRDHLSTSGGFWAERRTVSACVRCTFSNGARAMRSINCPSTGPQSVHTDERVTIPLTSPRAQPSTACTTSNVCWYCTKPLWRVRRSAARAVLWVVGYSGSPSVATLSRTSFQS